MEATRKTARHILPGTVGTLARKRKPPSLASRGHQKQPEGFYLAVATETVCDTPCFLKLLLKVVDIPPGTRNMTGKDKELVQEVSSAQHELAVDEPCGSSLASVSSSVQWG